MVGRIILAVTLAATLASAQGGRGGGGMGGNNMGTTMPQTTRMQRQSPFEQFCEKLKLNKEQTSDAQNILAAAAQQAGPVREQLDKNRADIAGAMIEGKSQDEIKKLVDAHSGLQAQLDGIEADAFGKLFATLKPNQQSKAGQAFEFMAAMFDRPGGGGGGRRGERR
jgi:hypothetical protein